MLRPQNLQLWRDSKRVFSNQLLTPGANLVDVFLGQDSQLRKVRPPNHKNLVSAHLAMERISCSFSHKFDFGQNLPGIAQQLLWEWCQLQGVIPSPEPSQPSNDSPWSHPQPLATTCRSKSELFCQWFAQTPKKLTKWLDEQQQNTEWNTLNIISNEGLLSSCQLGLFMEHLGNVHLPSRLVHLHVVLVHGLGVSSQSNLHIIELGTGCLLLSCQNISPSFCLKPCWNCRRFNDVCPNRQGLHAKVRALGGCDSFNVLEVIPGQGETCYVMLLIFCIYIYNIYIIYIT